MSDAQADLFGANPARGLARAGDPSASKRAAHRHVTRGRHAGDMARVREAIRLYPGSTAATLAERTGLAAYVVRKRTADLRRRGEAHAFPSAAEHRELVWLPGPDNNRPERSSRVCATCRDKPSPEAAARCEARSQRDREWERAIASAYDEASGPLAPQDAAAWLTSRRADDREDAACEERERAARAGRTVPEAME